MANEGNPGDFSILTNNPLVESRLKGRGAWSVDYRPELSLREILVAARDKVYAGHTLYTHPLSGSVKPNETPYKSVIISVEPHGINDDFAVMIASAIETFDKLKDFKREYNERVLKDFQLIDYTLICGAIGFDALSGFSDK